MNFEQARFNMVEQQIRTWNVLDQDVLDLFLNVRREEFVPAAYKNAAFTDVEIPLAAGAKMFKPVIEGKILQALQPKRSDTVLEIGAGSGYFAALLAACTNWVRTIDIEPELVRIASDNLSRAGVNNVIVEEGDGAQGWPQRAPYDVIVISGSLPVLPQSLLTQLKPGGRLFAFVGNAPVMSAQLTTCVAEGQFRSEDVFEGFAAPLQNALRGNDFSL